MKNKVFSISVSIVKIKMAMAETPEGKLNLPALLSESRRNGVSRWRREDVPLSKLLVKAGRVSPL